MHLFHPNRTSSHPDMALSLQSNTIVVSSLLSDGKIDLDDETIGVCSRNGHVLGDGDTKAAEFADDSVGSEIGSLLSTSRYKTILTYYREYFCRV